MTSVFRLNSGSDAILLVIARPVKAANNDTAIEANTKNILCETSITQPTVQKRYREGKSVCSWGVERSYNDFTLLFSNELDNLPSSIVLRHPHNIFYNEVSSKFKFVRRQLVLSNAWCVRIITSPVLSECC